MEKPIGIFDSGIGGLSVLNKLKELLPNESFVYLADNINCPYGNKSKKEIVFFSIKNTSKLIELNCKMIVVACNTATTNAIQKIRERVSVPVIGIEPGIKPAINYTKTNNIGVLATEKTLSSKLFMKTSKENKIHNIKIHEQIGYDLVNTIEKRSFSRNELFSILKSYLTPMINKNIDCLVLGCTHYNFLIDIIEEIIPENIILIDTITPVINHIKNTLISNEILNNSNSKRYIHIFHNDNPLPKEYIQKDYILNYLKF